MFRKIINFALVAVVCYAGYFFIKKARGITYDPFIMEENQKTSELVSPFLFTLQDQDNNQVTFKDIKDKYSKIALMIYGGDNKRTVQAIDYIIKKSNDHDKEMAIIIATKKSYFGQLTQVNTNKDSYILFGNDTDKMINYYKYPQYNPTPNGPRNMIMNRKLSFEEGFAGEMVVRILFQYSLEPSATNAGTNAGTNSAAKGN